MRPIVRLSLMLLALFLTVAPVMSFAQSAGTTAGSSTTSTTTGNNGSATGGSNTGGAVTAPNSGSATTTDKSTSPDSSTTTTTTTTTSVPWVWIIVGAVVVIGIIGIVAASNRGDTTTRIVN